jgi:peptidoglycan L-alanyl-D-glutamate endopeptidase CwlK
MSTALRNEKAIESLDPVFQVIVRRIIRDYEGSFLITDGFRSMAKQLTLYNDPKVFAAAPGFSLHNFGMAIDVVPIRDGKIDYADIEAYKAIAKVAKKHGCEWGGDWKQVDMPHIQCTQGLTIAEVRNGKRLLNALVPQENDSWLFMSLPLEKMIILTRKALNRSEGLRKSALKRKLERLLDRLG